MTGPYNIGRSMSQSRGLYGESITERRKRDLLEGKLVDGVAPLQRKLLHAGRSRGRAAAKQSVTRCHFGCLLHNVLL